MSCSSRSLVRRYKWILTLCRWRRQEATLVSLRRQSAPRMTRRDHAPLMQQPLNYSLWVRHAIKLLSLKNEKWSATRVLIWLALCKSLAMMVSEERSQHLSPSDARRAWLELKRGLRSPSHNHDLIIQLYVDGWWGAATDWASLILEFSEASWAGKVWFRMLTALRTLCCEGGLLTHSSSSILCNVLFSFQAEQSIGPAETSLADCINTT